MENLEEKGKIVLSRLNDKINNGEYDHELKYPFMSRKLFKTLLKKRVEKEVENKKNPVLSNSDIKEVLNDLEETAKETIKVFFEKGILKVENNEIVVNSIFK